MALVLAGLPPAVAAAQTTAATKPATSTPTKPSAKKKPAAKPTYRKVDTPVEPPQAVAAPAAPPEPEPAPVVAQAAPAPAAAAAPAEPAKTGLLGSMKRKLSGGHEAGGSPVAGDQNNAAAASWSPPVDMKGVDQAKYEQDTASCEQYANGVDETHAGTAATHSALKVGGITAAALGVAVVATGGLAAIPFAATGIGMGAAGGAGIGAITGGAGAQKKYQTVVNSCMAGRGYTVLKK